MFQSRPMKAISHNAISWEPVSHDPEICKKVIFRNGEAENVTQVSRTRFLPGQATTPHTHTDMTEIYSVESGSLDFTVNEVTSTVEGPANVVIMPGESHSIANQSSNPVEVMYIGVIAAHDSGTLLKQGAK